MTQFTNIEHNGKTYLWNGKTWYDMETYHQPPAGVTRELDAKFPPESTPEDTAPENLADLLTAASRAREAGQWIQAERFARRALELAPRNPAAAAVLCAFYRAMRRPWKALSETEAFKDLDHGPLLTSRAAAFCDLEKWEEAKRELARALAIETTEHALNVLHRIEAARADLYD